MGMAKFLPRSSEPWTNLDDTWNRKPGRKHDYVPICGTATTWVVWANKWHVTRFCFLVSLFHNNAEYAEAVEVYFIWMVIIKESFQIIAVVPCGRLSLQPEENSLWEGE